MLDLDSLRLTAKDLHWTHYTAAEGRVADAATAKALEGVQVWLESYEDPLVKGMGQWLREHLAAGIPKEGE